jgi:hypothetical protein
LLSRKLRPIAIANKLCRHLIHLLSTIVLEKLEIPVNATSIFTSSIDEKNLDKAWLFG